MISTLYDVVPISASSTNNVFGEAFNTTNGPASAARCYDILIATAACTINCVTAAGQTRTGVPLQAGENHIAVIQISSISTGSVFGGIVSGPA